MIKHLLIPVLAIAVYGFGFHAAADIVITKYIAGTFIDISGTGSNLGLGDDGERTVITSLLGQLRIGNNGAVGFATNGEIFSNNDNLPSTLLLGGGEVFAPYWDDLDSDSGGVFWQEFSDRVIVQWHDRPHFSGIGIEEGITFQVQLFANQTLTSGVIAQFLYLDTSFAPTQSANDHGARATIGYQLNQTEAVQWSFNSPGSVVDGDVLTILASVPEPSNKSLVLALMGFCFVTNRRRLLREF
ncbi:MAG: hypothetical protein R3C03_19345 [Pirellulaceae bacterium]